MIKLLNFSCQSIKKEENEVRIPKYIKLVCKVIEFKKKFKELI